MGFNPEGGTVNFQFATNNSHSDLREYLTISRGCRRHKDGESAWGMREAKSLI